MKKKGSPLKKRLNMLLCVCLIPLIIIVLYLLVTMSRFADRYDAIVENITMANAYNIDFKEDIDYIMYIIVVNSERAEELVDTQKPYEMIDEARGVFQNLYEVAEEEYAQDQLERILTSLDTLEDRVVEIEENALVTGEYDKNLERLDGNIRVLTELIQEQIQKYIYYEATNLEALREDIRQDVNQAIQLVSVLFIVILVSALLISRKIMTGITEPIQELCEVTKAAGTGDFQVRAQEESNDELAQLGTSFNQMVEQIGDLVEGIKTEQQNLKAAELKLMQAQINPHFLYNTLDAIVWLAEAGEKEQVVKMVTALSNFFRTALSKGQDAVSVKDEETHVRSYLQIQQFRYQDILEYEIWIPEELQEYRILKMTLQPLVENALYHGIKNKRRLGHILVTGEKVTVEKAADGKENGEKLTDEKVTGEKVADEKEMLVLKVSDDGLGMTPERLSYVRQLIRGEKQEIQSTGDSGSGFGMFNVAQRIRLNYGPEYGLEVNSVYGEGTEVTVVIPAEKNEPFS